MVKNLCKVTKKCYEKKHNCLILHPDQEALQQIDKTMWSFEKISFIPHQITIINNQSNPNIDYNPKEEKQNKDDNVNYKLIPNINLCNAFSDIFYKENDKNILDSLDPLNKYIILSNYDLEDSVFFSFLEENLPKIINYLFNNNSKNTKRKPSGNSDNNYNMHVIMMLDNNMLDQHKKIYNMINILLKEQQSNIDNKNITSLSNSLKNVETKIFKFNNKLSKWDQQICIK
ncbi:MAG TPA: DNA polymerase III subunit chi [Candidatus Megaira endosymbiont of Hartmannula sinica]|nr:DNA polymerase III subunit chi [Candidatus Megaera endosymbiont of Hartmannula sinica]